MNPTQPTVTDADRKCWQEAFIAGGETPDLLACDEAAAAVIAAHREASNAEEHKKAMEAAQMWLKAQHGRLLAERDAAVERAEAWKRVAIVLANSVMHGIHSGIAEYHALYAAEFAASEQATNREGKR